MKLFQGFGGFAGAPSVSISMYEYLASASGVSVAQINVDSVFTTDYDYYQIQLDLKCSANATGTAVLRSGGSNTSSNYQKQYFSGTGTNTLAAGRIANWGSINGVTWFDTDIISQHCNFYIINPAQAVPTYTIQANSDNPGGTGIDIEYQVVCQSDSTAFDGIGISTTSGSLTGDVRVYGWRN